MKEKYKKPKNICKGNTIYFSEEEMELFNHYKINNNFSETIRTFAHRGLEQKTEFLIDDDLARVVKESVIKEIQSVMNETNRLLYKANYMSVMNNIIVTQLLAGVINNSHAAAELFRSARSIAHKKLKNKDFDFNIEEFIKYNMK